MKATYQKLDNGLTVISDPMEVDSVSIGVWINAGSSKENKNQCGIAHMLEHMAFKGTENRSSETIVREIEDVGGDINAYTSKEVTAYYLKVLHEHKELGIDILSDIVKNSIFPKHEIEREKSVIISEIGQSFDSPDDRVFENFTSTAFKGQSIGRPILGTKKTISAFERKDLKSFCMSHYAPENIVVVCSGRVEHQKFSENVKEGFAGFKHNYKPIKLKSEWYSGFCGEDRDLKQTQLVFGIEGFKNFDNDRYSFQALSIILGGGMSSRLFQEIREKRGICYSIFSFSQMQSSTGYFGFYAGTYPENVQELLETSINELNKLKSTITEAEVLKAKAQIRSSFMMGQENNSSRSEYLAKTMIIFGHLKTTKEVLLQIENISKNSLVNAIERLLFCAKPVLSVIGKNSSYYKRLDINSLFK